MATIYQNFASGNITDDPLEIDDTTVNSATFTYLPQVADPNVMWISLDPVGDNGSPEIVKIVSHSLGATSVVVIRAQQSTIAREHPNQTSWASAITKSDLDGFTGNVTNLTSTVANLDATLVAYEATVGSTTTDFVALFEAGLL